MNRPEQFAAEAAKEITVAAVTNCPNTPAWAHTDTVAEFYETVYNKILEIVKAADKDGN